MPNKQRRIIIYVVAMCCIVSALSSCQDERVAVDFHVIGNPVIAAQSARALARSFATSYPQHKTNVQLYSDQEQMIEALLNTPNSFALLDSASISTLKDNSDIVAVLGIRSLFAVYYYFLHILVDASQLINEEQPQINRPILFYDFQKNSALYNIGEQIFSTSAMETEIISEMNDGTIDQLQRGRVGAILFFDSYPSPLILDNIAPYTRARLLSLSKRPATNLIESVQYLDASLLPVSDYPYLINSESVLTVHIPMVLITDAATDIGLVADLCEVFVANIEGYRTLYPQFESLSVSNIGKGLGVEQHIGIGDCIP